MNGHFAMYYVNSSFYSIDDEMDIKIMEILANGDLPIKEIAATLNKAPSTVALRLRRLKDDGLLTSRVSEYDSRSTIYGLSDCELIATKRPPVDERNALEKTLEPLMRNEIPLIRGIIKMFYQHLENLWLDAIPSIDPVAKELGEMIAERIGEGDFFTVLTELKNFFSGMKIGDMTFSVSDSVNITVKDVDAADDMERYLFSELISSIAKSAMEHNSQKRMNKDSMSWTGNELSLKFSFARY